MLIYRFCHVINITDVGSTFDSIMYLTLLYYHSSCYKFTVFSQNCQTFKPYLYRGSIAYKLYLRNCSYIQFQRVFQLFYCSSNYFGSLFYPDRRRRCCCCCGCWCWRCCCCCWCWFCWCFCHSRSGWLVGTWHVPFPLFVVGRRMNFSVGICALSSVYGDLRNVRLYLYLYLCVSLFELQLPRWILLGRSPLSIYLSLQVYSCDFSYFSFALLFRIRFRLTSLFIHYVYWLILDTFGTLYSISAMHFMHSTSHIRRLIFHF